jgi:hypothetical protein
MDMAWDKYIDTRTRLPRQYVESRNSSEIGGKTSSDDDAEDSLRTDDKPNQAQQLQNSVDISVETAYPHVR